MTVSRPTTTPMVAELPQNTDVGAIVGTLAKDDHVAGVSPGSMDQLQQVVDGARSHGIALSVVVVPGNPSHDSDLRDLATVVGKSAHGTVVVLSDDSAGTYSDAINRDRLERAEDVAKNRHAGHSVEAAQAFVSSLEQPEPVSWTAVTEILLAGLVLAIAALYYVKRRRAQ